jgi:hypothetical protein
MDWHPSNKQCKIATGAFGAPYYCDSCGLAFLDPLKPPCEIGPDRMEAAIERQEILSKFEVGEADIARYRSVTAHGYTSIQVMPELTGLVWDSFTFNWVAGILRPSAIRVVDSVVDLDSRLWRVTVFVDSYDNMRILRIAQEVEVFGGSGAQMKVELFRRMKERDHGPKVTIDA